MKSRKSPPPFTPTTPEEVEAAFEALRQLEDDAIESERFRSELEAALNAEPDQAPKPRRKRAG